MIKSISNRIKASVMSVAMAATVIPAYAVTMPATAAVSPAAVSAAAKAASTEMDASASKKTAAGTFPAAGAKSITFTIESDYEGQSFSYGLGVEINESPYWTEHNATGGWDDDGEGYAIKLKKGSNTVTVDLSDLDIKAGGRYEFRCYYSAHWDNSTSSMIDNSVTLTGVTFNGSTTTDPSDPDTPSEIKKTHKQSGEWSFTDNEDGTATISATVAKQLDNLDYALTLGYDEDYYVAHPDEKSDDAPINSHKFTYKDFGLNSMDGVTIESLSVVCESDKDLDVFMYGGGMNVKAQSPSDLEYAKQIAGIEGKGNAGYWYNDMGDDEKTKFEEAGAKFLIDDIGTGCTINGAGTYIEAYWEMPDSVQQDQGDLTTDAISFQFWYGTEKADDYTPLEDGESVTLTSAVLTYTITKTVPYTSSIKTALSKTLSHSDTSKNSLEIDYADLGIKEDMDVYAIRFDVSSTSDIGKKLVYNTGTGTTDEANGYWYQDDVDSVVIEPGKSAEIMWIIPDRIAANESNGNLVNPEGKVYLGYYYGEADSIKVDNVEVYYNVPETTTTTTTTTTSATTTTTTTTTEPKVSLYGDANCDGKVDLSDAVMILQSISNPDKYGVNGSSESHITAQGVLNGDVYANGTGLTPQDALSIQKYVAELISELPES